MTLSKVQKYFIWNFMYDVKHGNLCKFIKVLNLGARLYFVLVSGVVKEEYSITILGQFSLILHKKFMLWVLIIAPRQALLMSTHNIYF